MILGKQTVRFSKLDENVDEKKSFETPHETILNVSGPAVCRICHSGECSGPFGDSDAGEPLITPCKCKGTMGLFHQSCLVKWLKSSDTRGCEICGYNYEIYCSSPSILSFIFKGDDGIEHRNFLKDLLIFLILSPSVFAITSLCIFPWVNNLLMSPKPITFNNFNYDNFVLVIFAFLVLLGYSFWLLVTCSFHRNSIQAWKKHHLKVVSVKPYQHSEVYMFARDETTVCALQMDGTLPDLPENMYDKTVLAQSTPRIKGKTVLSKSLEAAPVLLNFRDYSSFSQ